MAEVRLPVALVDAIVQQLRQVAADATAHRPIDVYALDRTADALTNMAAEAIREEVTPSETP
jgi:hypothetical protein